MRLSSKSMKIVTLKCSACGGIPAAARLRPDGKYEFNHHPTNCPKEKHVALVGDSRLEMVSRWNWLNPPFGEVSFLKEGVTLAPGFLKSDFA